MLQIKPILAALKRHKAGTILIVLQIALTLAIVCNAMFIINQRVARMSRPTGMDESNLLVIQNHWVGVNTQAIPTLTHADLLTLRQLPGVEDATRINAYPLSENGSFEGIRLDPNMKPRISLAAEYFVDDHALPTMGVQLVAGRNFRADEIHAIDPQVARPPSEVIITKALADKLYSNGTALGKPIYIGNDNPPPSTIIGIVGQLQAPFPNTNFVDCAVLLPSLLEDNDGSYLIRSKPDQLAIIAKEAPATLLKLNRMRVFSSEHGIRTFDVVRIEAYKSDRGIAIVLGSICVVLLIITGAGIVGLTSFWVGQRRKQIGVRRALGATRGDILTYFLTENFLISLLGLLIGTVLAICLSEWLVIRFEMQRLSILYLLTSSVVLLLLGQAATLNPALRASRVPPVEATRSV
ncbi:ABC transporter permease [Dyella caseinilytica]|uniref:FtsX-like permease family protein n=1 Tax=Dyella caseinilytica TaxID=1849581 RepID=A0ABX7GTL1_9GAMM|nr:FtsX-like permease family protein [Dyella caseinilytica]QRN53356.1 FtsX-like permease family protein [Dyella caseinilytica]